MITIDASVLVAADADDEIGRGAARAFLRAVLAARLAVHQPALCVVEVTAAVARRTQDPEIAGNAALRVLELPGLVIHPLDLDAALEASGLASRTRLRAADSIYAATALRHGTQLVTLDLELRERAAPIVETFTPTEWLATHAQE